MAYAFVQGKQANVGIATSVSITFASAVTTNNRIVSTISVSTANTASVSTADNAGGGSNSYTNDSDFNDLTNVRSVIASGNIARGGGAALTVTVTFTTSGSASMSASEYSGLSTATGASAVDTTGTNFTAGAATTLSVSASPNPTAANEAAIAWFDDFAANTYTASSGTIRLQGASEIGQACVIDVASVVGTTTDSATVSANGGADHENMVVYKLAPAGAFPSHAQGMGRKPLFIRRSLSVMALQTPTFPSTLPRRAIQKPPLRKRVSVVAVAPQTPTVVSTSVKAIQKPRLIKRQSIPVVAPQTPTIAATSVKAIQKRPLKPLKEYQTLVAKVGVTVNFPATTPTKAIQKPRLRQATSFALSAPQTPTVASTQPQKAIQKPPLRMRRSRAIPALVTIDLTPTVAKRGVLRRALKRVPPQSLIAGSKLTVAATSAIAIQKRKVQRVQPKSPNVAIIAQGILATTQRAKQKSPLKPLRPAPLAVVAIAVPSVSSTSAVAKQKAPLRRRQSISVGAPKAAPFVHKPVARSTRVPTAEASPKSLQRATRVPASETKP